MTTRDTSIEAYYAAVETGLIEKREREILKTLAHNGPMTANEIHNKIEEASGVRLKFDSNTCARLTAMSDKDAVVELDKRECAITKKRCIVWAISEQLPHPPDKARVLRRKITHTEKRLVKLRKQLADHLAKTPQP